MNPRPHGPEPMQRCAARGTEKQNFSKINALKALIFLFSAPLLYHNLVVDTIIFYDSKREKRTDFEVCALFVRQELVLEKVYSCEQIEKERDASRSSVLFAANPT